MNWRRGLLRAWLVTSAVWVTYAGWLLVSYCRASVSGDYEMALVLRVDIEKLGDWHNFEEFKTYFQLPSEVSPKFYRIQRRYVGERVEGVKDGSLVVREFTGGERLYLKSVLGNHEIGVAQAAFSHQRFDRLLKAAGYGFSYFLWLAVSPPLIAMGAFLALRWIVAGFR